MSHQYLHPHLDFILPHLEQRLPFDIGFLTVLFIF